MKEYKLTRFNTDKSIDVDKLKFETFEQAVGKARRWLKDDDKIHAVRVDNGDYKATVSRP